MSVRHILLCYNEACCWHSQPFNVCIMFEWWEGNIRQLSFIESSKINSDLYQVCFQFTCVVNSTLRHSLQSKQSPAKTLFYATFAFSNYGRNNTVSSIFCIRGISHLFTTRRTKEGRCVFSKHLENYFRSILFFVAALRNLCWFRDRGTFL